MIIYGFWFYEELANNVGTSPGKHRGDREDSYMPLEDSRGNIFDVKTSSLRLELFRQNPKCVSCHRIGQLWILESHRRNEPPHLNLYHVGEEDCGEWKKLCKDGLVMMTKDHIVPRSKGGPTTLENLQTMCAICNGKKGNQLFHNSLKDKKSLDPLLWEGVIKNLQGKIHFA